MQEVGKRQKPSTSASGGPWGLKLGRRWGPAADTKLHCRFLGEGGSVTAEMETDLSWGPQGEHRNQKLETQGERNEAETAAVRSCVQNCKPIGVLHVRPCLEATAAEVAMPGKLGTCRWVSRLWVPRAGKSWGSFWCTGCGIELFTHLQDLLLHNWATRQGLLAEGWPIISLSGGNEGQERDCPHLPLRQVSRLWAPITALLSSSPFEMSLMFNFLWILIFLKRSYRKIFFTDRVSNEGCRRSNWKHLLNSYTSSKEGKNTWNTGNFSIDFFFPKAAK